MKKQFEKHFLLVIIFILATQIIWGQNREVSGTIINSITGKPISGITLGIKGTNSFATTNKKGYYSISVPDTVKSITFTDFTDYEVIEIKKHGEDKIDLYLSDTNLYDLPIEDLIKIKVTTANKIEQSVLDIPASVIVISRSDIKKYGYQTLPEILENVLGLFKHDDYRAVSFGVRGFFSNVYNRTFVLLVNGVEQKLPAEDYNLFTCTNIQVEAIEKIEIVRGPLTIAYGNNAFFGAINIITNTSESENTSVNTAYGVNNTFRSNITSTFQSNDLRLTIAAGFYKTDGRDVPFNKLLDSVLRYDGSWVKNATTKDFFKSESYNFNVLANIKGLYANISYDESNRNLIHNLPPILDTTKNIRIEKTLRLNLGYKKKITDNFSFDTRMDLVNYYENNLYEMGIISPVKIRYSIAQLTSSMLSGEATFHAKPTNWFSTIFGAKIISIPTAVDITDVPPYYNRMTDKANEPIISNALFVQFDFHFMDFRLIAGLRYDKQNKYEQKNTYYNNLGNYQVFYYTYDVDHPEYIPQLALIYQISPQNVFKLSYNKGISRPSYFENVYFLNVSHTTLLPQKISTIELNYLSILSRNFTLNSSLFYNRLDNLIARQTKWIPETSTSVVDFNNSGEFFTIGGELQTIFKPLNKLTFDLSFSYQKTKDVTYDIEAAYSPNFLAYFKTIYNLNKDISISIIANYVSEMEAFWNNSPSDNNDPNSPPVGRAAKTTPSYLNLDANLLVDNILNNRLSFNLHFTNLLNSEIKYAPTTVNSDILPTGTFDNGIQLSLTLRLRF